MRLLGALVLLAVFASLSGCTVPSTYSKSITVKKDASGQVIGIEETETVVQGQFQGYPLKFEHLKGIQPTYDSGSQAPVKMPRSR